MADEVLNQPSGEDAGQPEPANDNAAAQTSLSTTSQATSTPVINDTTDELEAQPLAFNVVGIGASAGGVEAYIDLFQHLAPDTGMAYVVVLHLAADQKSHLREILARTTLMPVLDIANGMKPEPDHIYVLPPRALLRLERGAFQLDPADSGQHTIDHFFYSLASNQKNRAIGIVLSGMDSDGALGLRAVKGEGGITMVQAPESARYPEMPRRSILLDHVDIVSTPSAMSAQLAQLGRQFRETNFRLLEEGAPTEEQHFAHILALMRSVSGVDFRLYKPSTLHRRIARRMLLHHVDTLRDYVSFLHANPNEIRELQEDALIAVTRFFRDPEVFEAFKNAVLPRIFDEGDPSQQVRIWIAGCSSGEEVYSLAICLLEYFGGTPVEPPIQIFGTDASEPSIQQARLGIYSENISADVSPERLRRFFIKTEKGYQITKRIRDLCIFARQNLCQDPPFSRMDLISCRNVLIYFGAELQRQLIPMFHYALRPNGFLILGVSETIREFTDLFYLTDRKHKIYTRNPATAPRVPVDVIPQKMMSQNLTLQPTATHLDGWGEVELQRAADHLLLSRYAPPGVVVNERLQILQWRGRVSPFLELRPGAASLDLLRTTSDTIAPQVVSAVRQAIEDDILVQVPGLRVSDGETTVEATLEVVPIHSVDQQSKCYLVIFAPAPVRLAGAVSTVDATLTTAEHKERLIAQLGHDLSSTKLSLQSLLEERDATNQELLSANEEIQSANEELQSTNEELETTKEELESSNEELHTVNEELQNRNAVLMQASNDLQNLLTNVNLPVLMLSNDLSIRHFTPPAQRIINVRGSDVGRPFGELRVNLQVEDLTSVFADVLETLAPREMEVQDREGHWYLLRVRPYRTTDNKIDGLVMALVDIDQMRRTQHELRAARDFSRSIIQGVPLSLVVVDSELRIRATNKAFGTLTRMTDGDLERRYLPALTDSLWGLENEIRDKLEELRQSRKTGDAFEFEHSVNGEHSRVFSIRGCVLEPGDEQYMLVTVEEITIHKEAERLLKKERDRLSSQVELTAQALGRSQDELRALAVSLFTSSEEERRRVARELHDDISQRLAALEIESDRVGSNLSGDSAAAKDGMQRIRGRLAQLSEDVRSMSHRLHPSTLEDLGLKPALRTLTEEFGQREKMIATFSSENVPENIPLDMATVLYRITQEALRNVSKHAGQTHARVSLRGTAEGLQLQVADFGQGFDMEAQRHGLGLVSMEERARQIGASLQIQSALGEGTKVTVNVPLANINRTQSVS